MGWIIDVFVWLGQVIAENSSEVVEVVTEVGKEIIANPPVL